MTSESQSQSASAPPPTSLERMEARLAELELKLGGVPFGQPASTTAGSADVASRIDRLMRISSSSAAGTAAQMTPDAKSKAEAKRSALHEECRTIDRLLSELAVSPLAGPTATSSLGGNTAANAPAIFRRMEVLASAESMKRDMDLLARIRDLTLIGAKGGAPGVDGAGGDASSSSKVVNCPIVSSERYNLPEDPEAAERLEKLCFRAARLSQRTAAASKRADDMLNSYGKIMMALSEKMVLAEEQLAG